ncbi:hypothetical protein SDC9_135602 [bioreactor metagenome]|uniref:Uncharacterized protein n=1 Tax=bioreactor metagenome TaxID=1076179 RepID=A0A645DHJ9_9ZZZZ
MLTMQLQAYTIWYTGSDFPCNDLRSNPKDIPIGLKIKVIREARGLSQIGAIISYKAKLTILLNPMAYFYMKRSRISFDCKLLSS